MKANTDSTGKRIEEILRDLVAYEYATYHQTTKPSKGIMRGDFKDMGYDKATKQMLDLFREVIGDDEGWNINSTSTNLSGVERPITIKVPPTKEQTIRNKLRAEQRAKVGL